MKKRIGFVSNSSSSNFIIIGRMIDEELNSEELSRKYLTKEAIDEFINDANGFNSDDDGWWSDLWYECAYDGSFKNKNLSYISDDGRSFLGQILVDEEYLEEGEHSFDELIELANGLGLGEYCKLYYGTRSC